MLFCDCQDIHGVIRIRRQILRHFSHYKMYLFLLLNIRLTYCIYRLNNPPRNYNAGVAAVLDGMENSRLDDAHVEKMYMYKLVMQLSSFLSY